MVNMEQLINDDAFMFGKGNPMIIPFVPRLTNFRPNFLGRDCLLNDFRLVGEDKHFVKEMYMYNNLDLQHKAMIDTAINVLREEQIGDFRKLFFVVILRVRSLLLILPYCTQKLLKR